MGGGVYRDEMRQALCIVGSKFRYASNKKGIDDISILILPPVPVLVLERVVWHDVHMGQGRLFLLP